MPDFTTASAIALIRSSLTLQANLFHEFQPMGGVSARLGEGELCSCAARLPKRNSTHGNKNAVETTRVIFMQTFYQKRLQIGTENKVKDKRPNERRASCLSIYNAGLVNSLIRAASGGGFYAQSSNTNSDRTLALFLCRDRWSRQGSRPADASRNFRRPQRCGHSVASGFGRLRRFREKLHDQRQWRKHVVRD